MENIRDKISEYNEEAVLFEGLNDAIIGIGCQHGGNYVAIYSKRKIIHLLEIQFLMDQDEVDAEGDPLLMAIEWYDFNIECLYAGEHTPIILIDDFENE